MARKKAAKPSKPARGAKAAKKSPAKPKSDSALSHPLAYCRPVTPNCSKISKPASAPRNSRRPWPSIVS